MSDVLVSASGLTKVYPKVHRSADRVRALGRLLFGRRGLDVTRVLDDISLEVRRGQSLGIIGENGAGKSTLLKLITGVLTPTHGHVHVDGRVGALLELGAGFHPEFSGRDNIIMAAALYGLSAAEMRARSQQIIDFAEIGKYIDEPVKHYSSGMVVRLGFAVIAALKPDLLITDEVLAVGDESFQRKCVQWIEDYLDDGGTLLLVSHSMYHIQRLCRQALWLRSGEAAMQGDVFEVTQAYLAFHERKSARQPEEQRNTLGEFSLVDCRLNGVDSKVPIALSHGGSLTVSATIRSRDGRAPVLHVGIVRADGTAVYGISSDMDGVTLRALDAQQYQATIEFASLPLLPGGYMVRVHPMDPEGLRLFDTLERGLVVRGQSREIGLVRLQHRWLDVAEEGEQDYD